MAEENRFLSQPVWHRIHRKTNIIQQQDVLWIFNHQICFFLVGSVEVVDIRNRSNNQDSLLEIRWEIVKGSSRPTRQKTHPTLLFYDERGSQLYDELTTNAPEYYRFTAEEEILKRHVDQIVRAMHRNVERPSEGIVVELGLGYVSNGSV